MDRLLEAVQRYQLHPIGFAFDIEDFEALSLDERRRLTGATRNTRTRVHKGKVEITDKLLNSGAPTQPYFLGFNYIITEALKIAPRDARVNFVFDQRIASEGWAADLFENIARFSKEPVIRGRLGQLSYGVSENYEPLQAADLYAYVWNRILHQPEGEVRASRPSDQMLYDAHHLLTKRRKEMSIGNANFYRTLLEHADLDRDAGILRALGLNGN